MEERPAGPMGHLVAWMVTIAILGLCLAAWAAGIGAVEGAWSGLQAKSTTPTSLLSAVTPRLI